MAALPEEQVAVYGNNTYSTPESDCLVGTHGFRADSPFENLGWLFWAEEPAWLHLRGLLVPRTWKHHVLNASI